MKRALLMIACVSAGSACAAQQGIAAGSAQPAVTGTARSAQPAITKAAGNTQPAVTPTARSVQSIIGRLFFSPAERTQLDIARMQKKPPPQAQPDAAPPEPPPVPQIVSYGGIVRRSDGRALLWINNRLVEEKEALAGLNLKGRVRPDGAVTVQVPQTGGSIDVKVGQSIELQTGKVAERRPAAEDAKAPTADAKPPSAEAKGTPSDGKAATADTKAPQADAKAPPAAKPESEPPRNPEAPGAVGLKLDRGGRTLQPAEEQQSRSRNENR